MGFVNFYQYEKKNFATPSLITINIEISRSHFQLSYGYLILGISTIAFSLVFNVTDGVFVT